MKKSNFISALFLSLFLFTANIVFGQNIYTYLGIPGYWGGPDTNITAIAHFNPYNLASDVNGNIYFSEPGKNVVKKIKSGGIITVFAGNGGLGYYGDGVEAITANIDYPTGIAVDRWRSVYICDRNNNRVRKVDTNGIITLVAGVECAGYSGDGYLAIDAQMYNPNGVAVDSNGIVYISDSRNSVIRSVDVYGIMHTYAGNHTVGYSGDGGSATSAQLNNPMGLTIGTNGNLYIADCGNNVIRMVNHLGIISTVAGTGTSGTTGNGGPATNANLMNPNEVKIDANGVMYIGDASYTLRVVGTNDTISVFAGNGSWGYSGDGGLATAAKVEPVSGITFDAFHNVYLTATGWGLIRRIGAPNPGIRITSTIGDTICYGSHPHFFATVIDDSTPHYRWLFNGFVAGTDSFEFTPTSYPVGSQIRCILLSAEGTVEMAVSNPLYIDTLPNIGFFNGPSTFCLGSPSRIWYYSTYGYNSYWANTDSTVAAASYLLSAFDLTPLSPGSDTIINISTNMCGTDSAFFPITVLPNPFGPITGPSLVCANSTVTFTDTASGGYWWSTGFGSIMDTDGVCFIGDMTGPDYRVIISYGLMYPYMSTTSCWVKDTVLAYELQLISGPAGLCVGDTAHFNDTNRGNPMLTGVWDANPAILGTINPVTGLFEASTTNTGTVIISYSLSSVCFMTDTIAIKQIKPVVGSTSVCIGNSTFFSDSATGGTWTLLPTSLAVIDSFSGLFTADTTTGQAIITYSLFGRCSITDTVTIAAYPLVEPISGPVKVDSSLTISLTSATTGGVWASSNSAIATIDPASGIVTGISSGIVIITYSVTNTNGCTSFVVYTDTVINTAGVNKIISDKDIRLFPNPTSNTLTISWGINNEFSAVVITNMLGQEVLKQNTIANYTIFNVSQLPAGIFFVQLLGNNDAKEYYRFVKE